jgi:hypothetical protein
MEWCEETQGVDYVFGFAGNDVLHALTREAADAIAVLRALSGEDKLRGFKAFRYGAKSWDKERRFVARIEATPKGLDVRYVVTSLKAGARHLYETLYCARGNAENFIKLHKSQLASDRTSCRDPKANQFRLILHTVAYWLMLAMRGAVPARSQTVPCRVRHNAPSPDQDRCTRRGRCRPHPSLSADGMPRSRRLPRARRTVLRRRTIAIAALSPHRALRRNLQPSQIKSCASASPSSGASAATRVHGKRRAERAQLCYFG